MILEHIFKRKRARNTLQKNYKDLRSEYFKLLDDYIALSKKYEKLKKEEDTLEFTNNTKFPNWFVKLFGVKN